MEQAALRKAKPTDVFWRGLYGVERDGVDWVVEVDYFDIGEKVCVFRDGIKAFEGRSPAWFEIDADAEIQASMALYGMKRIHLVNRSTGVAEMLKPLPGTAEFLRQRFDEAHPLASKLVAALAWCTLIVALVTQAPNMVNAFLGVADLLSVPLPFSKVPTFNLPDGANVALSILGILAGLDRGLRMKHNALLDD